jgi:hypothetical protein
MQIYRLPWILTLTLLACTLTVFSARNSIADDTIEPGQ